MEKSTGKPERTKPGRRVIARGSKMSRSEQNILRLIARGNTTKQIALELGLSPKTVENHRGNICKRLGITGTASLLRFAMQHKSDYE